MPQLWMNFNKKEISLLILSIFQKVRNLCILSNRYLNIV